MGTVAAEYRDHDDEVVKRLRRMETRLMKLCGVLGMDPTRDKERVTVATLSPLVLDLAGLDVSIGDLVDACRKRGISGVAVIRSKGRRLGTVQIDTGDSNAR